MLTHTKALRLLDAVVQLAAVLYARHNIPLRQHRGEPVFLVAADGQAELGRAMTTDSVFVDGAWQVHRTFARFGWRLVLVRAKAHVWFNDGARWAVPG